MLTCALLMMTSSQLYPKAPAGDLPFVVPLACPGTGTTGCPEVKGSCNDIAWTAAYPLITHMQLQYYGNTRIVDRQWPSLVKYALLLSNSGL